MTIPITRHPNIGDGLDDQTSISLTLFNTILETANNRAELHTFTLNMTSPGSGSYCKFGFH
jgi:hypothetical protein